VIKVLGDELIRSVRGSAEAKSAADVPDAIKHPALRQLYHYWLDKRGDRVMPAPDEIDPVELKFILGNLMLIDVTHDPLDFTMRLHGTNLVQRTGVDLTGKGEKDAPSPGTARIAVGDFTYVVENREPFHRELNQLIDDSMWRYEGLALPLSVAGSRVDRLVVGVIHVI